MLELLFTAGQVLSLLVMLVGVYLAIVEAIDTAKGPDEDPQ